MQENNNEISTSESFNILTWQQILADEKLENVLPAIESIYEDKSRLRANSNNIIDGCNFSFMICMMLICYIL